MKSGRRIYLCGGCQSGGSTLVSWCFLQRPDMDGVLDARFDMIPALPPVTAPRPWIKFTIACFRFSDVISHYEDDGWAVTPLLVTRDVRSVFGSLAGKPYGKNGTTADDPPLRLRLRRFKQDFELFRKNGWPILRFESLLDAGEKTLRDACDAMSLPWDDGMLNWAKSPEHIAAAGYGNETFIQNRKRTLAESVAPSKGVNVSKIGIDDLDWLEREFADFNRAMNYPEHVDRGQAEASPARAIPSFEQTRRYARLSRKQPIKRWVRGLTGSPPLSPAEVADATGVWPTATDQTPSKRPDPSHIEAASTRRA